MTDLDLNAIRERVEAAREHIARNPVRPVALDFYAEDVPALLARVAELEQERGTLRDELVRAQSRLSKQAEHHKHWRDRAVAAEQALRLYGPPDADPLDWHGEGGMSDSVPPPAAATPADEETQR